MSSLVSGTHTLALPRLATALDATLLRLAAALDATLLRLVALGLSLLRLAGLRLSLLRRVAESPAAPGLRSR